MYVLGALCLLVALSEWLVRRTALRHLGSALLVIVLAAVAANAGILPAGSSAKQPVPVYEDIFRFAAPLSIFWLLLGVNLRAILRAGLPMIALFFAGALGTVAGVVLGMWLIDGPAALGPHYAALGGMFTATYIGGSVNFNALALSYDMMREGVLYAGAVAVDNIVTAVWMVMTLALPRLLAPVWRSARASESATNGADRDVRAALDLDVETLRPIDLGIMGALGLGALWLSEALAGVLAGTGFAVPSVLLLTVFALLLAQVPGIARAPGAQLLGLFAVYLFLAVIGAFCDLAALQSLGGLGLSLALLAAVVVGVHGLLTFGVARLFGIDPAVAAVASQANVGGGASALALARSLGRNDLVLPAVLIGSLGYAVGTFFGFWTAAHLLPGLPGF